MPQLHHALCRALKGHPASWEVLYVDDGSIDGSGEELARIAACIDHARGDVIALMDADLQNDPADIPLLLEHLDQGWDAVCG